MLEKQDTAWISVSARRLKCVNDAVCIVYVAGVMCKEGMCTSCSECVNYICWLWLRCASQHSWSCTTGLHFLRSNPSDRHPTVLKTFRIPGCRENTEFGDVVCQMPSFRNFFWFCEQKFLATGRSYWFTQKVSSHHLPCPCTAQYTLLN